MCPYSKRIRKHNKAVFDFAKAIAINPYNVVFYVNLCAAYLNTGWYDKAVLNCTKAIALNPELAMAYYNRGAACFFKREYNKAWVDVNKAQNLGLQIPPLFLKTLREVSGRQR